MSCTLPFLPHLWAIKGLELCVLVKLRSSDDLLCLVNDSYVWNLFVVLQVFLLKS